MGHLFRVMGHGKATAETQRHAEGAERHSRYYSTGIKGARDQGIKVVRMPALAWRGLAWPGFGRGLGEERQLLVAKSEWRVGDAGIPAEGRIQKAEKPWAQGGRRPAGHLQLVVAGYHDHKCNEAEHPQRDRRQRQTLAAVPSRVPVCGDERQRAQHDGQ